MDIVRGTSPPDPIKVFFSYAHADEKLRNELDAHLGPLKHEGMIHAWYDRKITPGTEWEEQIDQHLNDADLILLLVSPDFFSSEYCYRAEMKRAIARHEAKEAHVIPISLRWCDWEATPIAKLQGLPPNMKPITSWRDRDEPLAEVARGIRLAVQELAQRRTTAGTIPPQKDSTWSTIQELSRRQVERFFRANDDARKHSSQFIPEVYVRRTAVESELQRFLGGDALGLILVGEPGVGKTSLIHRWAHDLLASGHATLIYSCDCFSDLDIDREIAHDLLPFTSAPSLVALEQVDALADALERRFVLIFDAINDFRGVQGSGPEALIKRINGLVGRLPGHNLRVVASCSTTTWNRLDRLDAIRHSRNCYYRPSEDDTALRLNLFTPAEFEQAYARYRQFFQLRATPADLPAALRNRLRHPLLLRMLADAHRGRDELAAEKALTLAIYRRYYEERVRHRRDEFFVDELVAEMLHQRRATLSLADLSGHPRLGPEVLAESLDSSYYRLLDNGVLTEIAPEAPGKPGTTKFTHTTVGAYALARHLLRRSTVDHTTLTFLVEHAESFPLAWDTARHLLFLCAEPAMLAALAGSRSADMRELVAESLAEMHADEPDRSKALIKHLLEPESVTIGRDEVQRTALKAAYKVGPVCRDVFLWVAERQSPALRQVARDTLYLIWHRDPAFTFGLLHDILDRIDLLAVLNPRKPHRLSATLKLIEFVFELTIVIYINHCERPDVIAATDDLYYKLATEKLYLHLAKKGILGPRVKRLILRAVAAAFSKPILTTLLYGELEPVERFFGLAVEQRACLKRIAPTLEPVADLKAVRDDLVAMLESDILLLNHSAALALSVHACHEFRNTEPLLRSLFDALSARGRLRELFSFCVLLPQTPTGWVGLLEEFTKRLIAENPDVFRSDPPAVPAKFDIGFLPLGLAYGKIKPTMPMPLFEDLIRESVNRTDTRQVARYLAALGPVGFYYPDAVFYTLRTAIPDFADRELQDGLVAPLAVMRTLHADAVDVFLQEINTDEGLQRRVSAAADIELVRRYISWLGHFNNAVHQSLFYPKMRRVFTVGALNILAEARKADDFIIYYTTEAFRMAEDADFRLSRWTLPD